MGRFCAALGGEEPARDAKAAGGRVVARDPWCALALLLLCLPSCGLFRGSVNASPELRWFLFSNFGAQRVCPEMLKRGAALKLLPTGNAIGRFFPERCTTQVNDAAQTISVAFSGTGFAWMNATRTFAAWRGYGLDTDGTFAPL